MVKSAIVLGSILLCGAAQASQVTCRGSVYGYNVHLRASMSGSRFTSRANIVISKDSAVIKRLSMRVTSSRFIRGRSLYFTAKSAEGGIVVNTAFSGGRNYSGQVNASGSLGNITVPGVCSVR